MLADSVLNRYLRPLAPPRDRKCLAIFTCGGESVYLELWRSVFEEYAPGSIEKVQAILGARIGQGIRYHDITEELRDALADAYREAAAPRASAETGRAGH